MVYPDWNSERLSWRLLGVHDPPSPVASHGKRYVYFSFRIKDTIGIYRDIMDQLEENVIRDVCDSLRWIWIQNGKND